MRCMQAVRPSGTITRGVMVNGRYKLIDKGKDPELAYDDYIMGKRDYIDVLGDYR